MANESPITITKDMTFGEVMKRYPETASVFFKYQLRCIGCPMSAMETIEHGARTHSIKLAKLLEDLNKAAAIRR